MSLWATAHIEKLKKNESATFRPFGRSMEPLIQSGQQVTVNPATTIEVGDIVLCQVGPHHYLHLVKEIRDDKFLIGNNKGRTNGWIKREDIYGKY